MDGNEPIKFDFDVFLSHSSKDKAVVREFAERLRRDGLKVWLDDWEIRPGDPILARISDGLDRSRILLLFMSRNGLGSRWTTVEHQAILFADPLNPRRRFIPLLLDDAEIPALLRQYAYVDWQTPTDDAYQKLLAACLPAAPASEQGSTSPAPASTDSADHGESRPERRTGRERSKVPGPKAVLTGHTRAVRSVAISADGRRAVSGSGDRTVRVWDLETGDCAAVLQGHAVSVWGVAVTPDGRRAVSGSDDKTVRVWDLERGTCAAVLKRHTSTVWGVAVTPDGRRAVSGSADKTVRVWDLATGSCAAVLQGHAAYVRGVAVTSDGRRAVSGSTDGTVRVWDLETRSRAAVLKGHVYSVCGVAVTPDGRRAVSGSDDKTVRVWDLDTGASAAELQRH
jgi:hypothetical protein